MPEYATPTSFTANPIALDPAFMTSLVSAESFKPVFQLQPAMTAQLVLKDMNLAHLRYLTVGEQIQNAPAVTAAPTKVEHAVAGVDGKSYFVPQARVARRSTTSTAKNVFLERKDGKLFLRVFFDLVRHDSIEGAALALPVDNYAVALVDTSGNRIEFSRCDELPAPDGATEILSQLLCETEVDADQVVSIMQDPAAPGARFDVQGTVHYGLATKPAPKRKPPRRATTRRRAAEVRDHRRGRHVGQIGQLGGRRAAAMMASVRATPLIASMIGTQTFNQVVKPAVVAKPKPSTRRMSLGDANTRHLSAQFPLSNRENGMIYAQVTSGFGTEPWATWTTTEYGMFVDSPMPHQYYILPDEYRLAFDLESGLPAMSVLLVPPDQPDPSAPVSFSRDYRIRCRFSVVPYVDPARLENLRAKISNINGIAYPELIVGGVGSATFKLNTEHEGLGASLVGGTDMATEVSALGFNLVLDANSQFYGVLSPLLVGEGVGGTVVLNLLDSDDETQERSINVRLCLDRPAHDFLSTEMIVQPAPAPSDSPEDGTTPALAEPALPKLRITNRSRHEVSIAEVLATLLVVDESLPSPIGAVEATCTPSSLTIAAATDSAPGSVEIDLVANDATKPALYGGVGVGLVGVHVAIDPEAVLSAVHDLGGSADIATVIELQSYQLAHPEVLPESHTDVFGIEVQVVRGSSTPVTVFLTRDQPQLNVQVAFTLADALAGANPEQPTFSWRRRNMAGSGTSDWSDWAEITGRQLFVAPEGI